MARSYRSTPRFGFTTSPSDKPYKVNEHRRERLAVRRAIGNEAEVMPHPKLFGDRWLSPKDGKVYWAGATEKFMRK